MPNPSFTLRDLPRYETLKLLAQRYPDVDTHALSTYVILARVATDLLTHFDNYFASHQVSRGRFTVLAILNRDPAKPLNPCELADKAGVTRATMTGLLDGLERDGLIAREHVAADRRMLLVRLTPNGLKLLDTILPDYYKLMRTLLGGITDDEKQQLIQVLGKLTSSLPGAPIADDATAAARPADAANPSQTGS